MKASFRLFIPAALAAVLAGCAGNGDSAWPSLATGFGEESGPEQGAVASGPSPEDGLTRATATIDPAELGTYRRRLAALAARLVQHKDELGQIETAIARREEAYRTAVSKLSAGVSGEHWNAAQIELSRFDSETAGLKRLSGFIAQDVAQAASLLAVLEEADGEPEELSTAASGLVRDGGRLYQAAGDGYSARRAFSMAQNSWLASRMPDQPAGGKTADDADDADDILRRTPLLSIAFVRPDIEFRDQLGDAVGAARERFSDIVFDVVLVDTGDAASPGGEAALTAVLDALIDIGVPPGRVLRRRSDVKAPEIRVYVR